MKLPEKSEKALILINISTKFLKYILKTYNNYKSF